MRAAVSFPGCHRRGGVERVMVECVNFLAARGHETHALAHDFDHASLSPAVVTHQVDLPTHVPFLVPPAYRRSSRRVIAGLTPPPDVVASFGVMAPPGSVVWMQSVHAAWVEISRSTRSLGGRLRQRANPFHPVVLRMEKAQLRGREYAKVIALTPDVKADIMRFYDVPGADIEVIPNGYSAAEFHPERGDRREQMRAELGFGDEDRVVVFVANELERKGFSPLLRAVKGLGDPTVKVLAVGRLNLAEAAPEIERLGLAGSVRFTGPTSQVSAFYAASDVFALPTKYEAWGLVVVEAMACGLPVLTTRLAGAAVAVQDGVNGVLVDDPGDDREIARGLQRLLSGEHADADSVSASVKPYEWSHLLVDYERILREAIA